MIKQYPVGTFIPFTCSSRDEAVNLRAGLESRRRKVNGLVVRQRKNTVYLGFLPPPLPSSKS